MCGWFSAEIARASRSKRVLNCLVEILIATIHEIDQDRRGAPANALKIDVDFSEDQTGFFSADRPRHVILQEVADWAYFFDDMNLDRTPAGAETTFMRKPFINSRHV